MRSAWEGGVALILGLTIALGACAHEPVAPPPVVPSASTPVGACHHVVPACVGGAPSYARDVRPILEARCFKCHAGGGVAADDHDFSHVETLRAQKRALANEIGACAMPPTPEPPVPDREADVLLGWATCGAAE